MALGLVLLIGQRGTNEATFYGLFRADGLTVFLSLIILVAAILTVLVSASYVENLEGRMPLGEFYTLLAFATLGALLTAAAGDLIMIFVGIELSALATYILTAFAKRRTSALEGALKYFLLGLFASTILLYGMAWIYGSTASTDLDEIAFQLQGMVQGQDRLEASLLLGLLLVIVGIAFKMAAVPFHFWTPDAYDGAPTPVTGFMSVVPKAAAFAAAVRLLVQGSRPAAGRLVLRGGFAGRRHDDLRQPGGHFAAQRQAHAGLFLDRPHRIHAGRTGCLQDPDRVRHQWR